MATSMEPALPNDAPVPPSAAIPTVTLKPSTNPSSAHAPIRIGTRRSELARVQTDLVLNKLQEGWPDRTYEVIAMDPLGDRDKITALHAMGAKSLWTAELEVLLDKGLETRGDAHRRAEGLDIIVHSCKDMPTQLPPTLSLGCTPPRGNPHDALALSPKTIAAGHSSLHTLPQGAVIGTGSLRRIAQLRRTHPHLQFADCRGNVPTRLAKLDAEDSPFVGLILAAAGLERLNLGNRITKVLNWKEDGIMHAVGQGAIGVETIEADEEVTNMLTKVNCPWTFMACVTERSLLRTLEGGCSVPIGVETQWVAKDDDKPGCGGMLMRAIVVSLDGQESVVGELTKKIKSTEDAEAFGMEMAKYLADRGADKILEAININREVLAQGGVA